MVVYSSSLVPGFSELPPQLPPVLESAISVLGHCTIRPLYATFHAVIRGTICSLRLLRHPSPECPTQVLPNALLRLTARSPSRRIAGKTQRPAERVTPARKRKSDAMGLVRVGTATGEKSPAPTTPNMDVDDHQLHHYQQLPVEGHTVSEQVSQVPQLLIHPSIHSWTLYFPTPLTHASIRGLHLKPRLTVNILTPRLA